jgi:hypothetical protein
MTDSTQAWIVASAAPFVELGLPGRK